MTFNILNVPEQIFQSSSYTHKKYREIAIYVLVVESFTETKVATFSSILGIPLVDFLFDSQKEKL